VCTNEKASLAPSALDRPGASRLDQPSPAASATLDPLSLCFRGPPTSLDDNRSRSTRLEPSRIATCCLMTWLDRSTAPQDCFSDRRPIPRVSREKHSHLHTGKYSSSTRGTTLSCSQDAHFYCRKHSIRLENCWPPERSRCVHLGRTSPSSDATLGAPSFTSGALSPLRNLTMHPVGHADSV
jgi:hypothetical protein